jgi:hypothetical protein
MSQLVAGHCPNCNRHNSFDASALILKASRLQCFWCGIVEDAAAYQLSQPGVSHQAKEIWQLVGLATVLFGLFKLVDHLSS